MNGGVTGNEGQGQTKEGMGRRNDVGRNGSQMKKNGNGKGIRKDCVKGDENEKEKRERKENEAQV